MTLEEVKEAQVRKIGEMKGRMGKFCKCILSAYPYHRSLKSVASTQWQTFIS